MQCDAGDHLLVEESQPERAQGDLSNQRNKLGRKIGVSVTAK